MFVDGEQVLDLTKAFAEQSGLRVGLSLLPATQDEIRQTAALQEAKVAAVKALGIRARTRSELQRKLLSRGLPPAAVTETLDWLASRNYLDDEQYAQQRWQSLSQRKLGSQAIFRKLVQEGVPKAIAEQVMAAQDTTLHETELVRELAMQRNESLKKLPWPQRRQRLYGFLARRGFSTEAISEALVRLELDQDSAPEVFFDDHEEAPPFEEA
ncbi:MAG: regulatory protein RecX [Armatimonadota bacterium]